MVEGSAIRNRNQKQQIVDFGGLRWGKIMPTDLDAFIDFGGKLFVFVEAKYGGASLSFGQRLAIERVCDACHSPDTGRYSVAFVCSHNSQGDIDLAASTVVQYRWAGKWNTPKDGGRTLREAVDFFRDMLGVGAKP